MSKQTIKKIAKWSLGTVAALFFILVLHLVIVMKPVAYDNVNIQLAKVELDDQQDSTTRSMVYAKIMDIEGVKSAKYFESSNSIVVSYDNNVLTNEQLLSQINLESSETVSLKTPSAQELASGCPIKDKNSMSYRFSVLIQNIFY